MKHQEEREVPNSPKEIPVEFSGLEVSYGSRSVLREISGVFRPGTLTALIGPNGSGKSTLLRTCAGLLPYWGSLRLGDEEVTVFSRREISRLVGVVPQQVRMTASFTVFDAVSLGHLPHQGLTASGGFSPEEERQVRDAAVLTDIEDLLLRHVSRLSGGETQQVLLATVLVQNTPVLLLDEPTSALDPRRTIRVFSLLRTLAAKGRTVVAAVHDVNLAVAFADRFLALKGGRAIFEASVAELGAEVLEKLYETPFRSYISEKGEIAWHACR